MSTDKMQITTVFLFGIYILEAAILKWKQYSNYPRWRFAKPQGENVPALAKFPGL